jgi:hypothetical protein
MAISSLLCAFAVAAAPQATSDSQPLSQPLFESHEVLRIRLVTELETVVKDIGRHVGDNEFEGEEEHPGSLSYLDSDGETVTVGVEVKTRGHFRRQKSTCNFPPLRLDFKTKDAAGTLFENQDKVKMVTHCQDGREEYEQGLLLEYLLYRAYQVLEDSLSFGVRLARVTYVDSTQKRDSLTRYGFLIENEDLMAARLGTEFMETQGLHPIDHLQSRTMVKVALFQFMALNTDWDVPGLHNVKLVGPIDGLVYPIPYDMDWSGIINNRYAKPDPSLGIRSVRDRLYRGFCRPADDYVEVIPIFESRRSEIYEIFRGQEGLDPRRLEQVLEDLDEFYEVLGDQRKFQRQVLQICRRS